MIVLKDLNLMPRKQIIKREGLRFTKSTLLVVGVVIVFSVLADLIFLGVKLGYNSQLSNQIKVIDKLSILEKNKAAYNIIEQKLKYRKDILDDINSNDLKITTVMDKIEEIIPADISLSNFSVDKEGKVTLAGTGDSPDSILDFYHSLKLSGLSDNIEFDTVKGTLGDSKGLDFTFTFKLRNGK